MARFFSFSRPIAALLLTLLAATCRPASPPEQTEAPFELSDQQLQTLAVDTVRYGQVTEELKFNGLVNFNPDKVANIFPLISGIAQNVNAKLGDYVRAGQVLGTVRSSDVANFDNAVAQAKAQVAVTKKQLQQQQDLFGSGLASQVDVTAAQANYDQAVAALLAAQRVLNVNGNSQNGQFTIKAPISGFIVQKNVTNGMAIRTDNGAPLYQISDLKNVWVEANVYEENIDKVHPGDSAQVTTLAYPDKVFRGRVGATLNVLDPNSKVMKIRVVLSNPNYLLKPQMFATVRLTHAQPDQKALAVKSSTLVFDHSQYYVVVMTGGKRVQLRPIDLIGINGPTAYVKAGLKPGERLVASDALLIYGALNS